MRKELKVFAVLPTTRVTVSDTLRPRQPMGPSSSYSESDSDEKELKIFSTRSVGLEPTFEGLAPFRGLLFVRLYTLTPTFTTALPPLRG